jgi:hypothetical protein
MRCATKSLFLPAVVLVAGSLASGCGSTATSVITNLPSKTASVSARPSATVTAPSRPTAAATATPTATPTATTTATPTATATATTTATATATTTATATSTATATVTATATAAAPAVSTTTPAATSSAVSGTGTGSGSSLLWLWILLGAAVLAGLIALIVRSARRRSAAATGWQSRLIDAYAKGSALHDAMSVAEAPGQMAAGDADARWYDIQRRADDLAQTLYALQEMATDDDDRARIADALASLQAVRSAMEAERVPGAADPQQAEVVRGRLYSFEASLRALRYGRGDAS